MGGWARARKSGVKKKGGGVEGRKDLREVVVFLVLFFFFRSFDI